ncbi:MAG: MBOAT family protein [Clostridiales Family XIII bacterium]|jgi:alginate O-acetyltransferase complex protein AlgI|nr:MBOAT family protein [Clostridiales Family XIII bacterium]
MLFSSLIFIALFLPAVILLYYLPLRKTRIGQNVLLLLASLFFYAWGEPKFVLVMMLSIICNWAFGLLAHGRRGKGGRAVIAGTVAFNIGIFFIFKYLNFAVENTNALFGTQLTVPGIALPIGISFFTFQAMSYVFDVYRGTADVQKNPMNVGLYISFFPQLIAGPIVRYQTIADQIKGRRETWDDFSAGVTRFITGFAKKILIANNMALLADRAFDASAAGVNTVLFAWLGALAYTLQIYYDFSGYSDMAIGLGRMFGFHFLENFNYPYISRSTTEFWRRWHMSLGQWFRDYVYFPLGGSRVGKGRLVLNLLVVWGLTGVWHGANWTFILWGLLYFATITAEKLTGFERAAWAQSKWGFALRHIYTLLLVMLGWVIFRAESIGAGLKYIGEMFGRGAAAAYDGAFVGAIQENIWFLTFGILFSMPIAKRIGAFFEAHLVGGAGERLPAVRGVHAVGRSALYVAAFVVCVSYLVKGSYNPFIYFNF